MNKELGVHIPLSRIFDLQTIAELSAFIVGGQQQTYESIVPVTSEPFYPVSSAQKKDVRTGSIGWRNSLPYFRSAPHRRRLGSFKVY
ncbi:hypothetical protein [Paenibacillus sp. RC343]|uniref:hypothetical protein n=1 Tax=Paenibacillus sp. RC343 TaxID=3045841 RepID=UPI0024BA5CAB|nr:hypothetical protein [Paenibacillus sp. RC343]